MTEEKVLTVDDLQDEERQPCEVWTRVMGYHRPVEQWNIGKRSEFRQRKAFKEPEGGFDDAR